jgi:hypothetical protein
MTTKTDSEGWEVERSTDGGARSVYDKMVAGVVDTIKQYIGKRLRIDPRAFDNPRDEWRAPLGEEQYAELRRKVTDAQDRGASLSELLNVICTAFCRAAKVYTHEWSEEVRETTDEQGETIAALKSRLDALERRLEKDEAAGGLRRVQ